MAVAGIDARVVHAVRTAEHALLLAARDSELAALRVQYDLLAVRYDDTRAPIDVDAIGAARTCALSGCDRRPWRGHHDSCKAHPTPAGATCGPRGAPRPKQPE